MSDDTSDDTYHITSTPQDVSSFVMYTNPFTPKVKPKPGLGDDGERKFSVTFNQGYLFDYANRGKRVPVFGGEKEIGEGAEEFQIKINFRHDTGAILFAEIVKGSGSSASFDNITADSQIEGEAVTIVGDAYYFIDLCEFESGSLKSLYIRENIHLHLRSHIQHFDPFVDEEGGEGVGNGILKPLNSATPNGLIEYRALCKDPEEGNQLRIKTEGSNIYFFVPSGSAEDDSSGGDGDGDGGGGG